MTTPFRDIPSLAPALELQPNLLRDVEAATSGPPPFSADSNVEGYPYLADMVEKGFMLAAKFLRKKCFTDSRDLRHRTQLAPPASVMAMISGRWLDLVSIKSRASGSGAEP